MKKYMMNGIEKNVEKLETKNGTIIVIDYKIPKSISMRRAVCIYNKNKAKVTELSYG